MMMRQIGGEAVHESGQMSIGRFRLFCFLLFLFIALSPIFTPVCYADQAVGDLRLQDLIDEALKNSPEILASQYRTAASTYRIPQAMSLPDPLFMFGYQNEGFNEYSYGEELMSQWMFSASQMFPFPGKRALKGEMARKDSESLSASYDSLKLKTVSRIKEIYYDLFLAYKTIDLLKDRTVLYSRIEDAALARYSSGIGQQQEVLMAQTEKYMLLEKEEMQKQKIESFEAMLNTAVGRDINAPLGRPAGPPEDHYILPVEEILLRAYDKSPEIRAREEMIASAEAKVKMAKKEYYPDFTITAEYDKKGGQFLDMWALTATMNIPLYYKTKQRQAVYEAQALLSEAKNELATTKLMLGASIRDNYSMYRAAGRLMSLYRDGVIPKAMQDFEAAISGYNTGKIDAIAVITTLRSLIDTELLYWNQVAEREKAIAKMEAVTGGLGPAGDGEKR